MFKIPLSAYLWESFFEISERALLSACFENMAPYKSSYYSRLLTFLGNFPHFKWNYSLYMNHSLQNINSVLDKCIIPRYLVGFLLFLIYKKFSA